MTSPNRPMPDGAITPGNITPYQDVVADEEAFIEGVKRRTLGGFFDGRDKFQRNLDDIIDGIASAIRGDSSILERFKPVQQAWRDGQEAMSDLWKRLSPLEEYAAAYMSTASGLWQGGKVTFDRMLVGSKGVTHEAGGFTLHDYGMWKIDAQIWPDIWVTNAGNTVDYEIRVLDLNGGVWHHKRFRGSSSVAFSASAATSVVVPEAGYRVEVHVTNIVAGRSLLGGSDRTHLIVHHINRELPKPGDNTGQN